VAIVNWVGISVFHVPSMSLVGERTFGMLMPMSLKKPEKYKAPTTHTMSITAGIAWELFNDFLTGA
jgi:hypothetical protein